MDSNLPNSTTTTLGPPHVRRLKTLKRGREENLSIKKEIELHTVLGITAVNNAALATSPISGIKKCLNKGLKSRIAKNKI